jgi:hypothetical protein
MSLTHSQNDLAEQVFSFEGKNYTCSRPHPGFGLVLERLADTAGKVHGCDSDYLHCHLLTPEHRSKFFDLIAHEGLVICRKLDSLHPSYRKVRGKSSNLKLSQAEYYHHDGCSCPQNPRIVEIRLPYQEHDRNVATAIAPFPAVMRAMLQALPQYLLRSGELSDFHAKFRDSPYWNFDRQRAVIEIENLETGLPNSADPDVTEWDKYQGQMIRIVRRELDAESCRAYYREVDILAGAYVLPWEMGESRLMLNFDRRQVITMQHRRAYQKQRDTNETNGHLVKRWTAEEV